jgi:undecaprenyl-diphosphatase
VPAASFLLAVALLGFGWLAAGVPEGGTDGFDRAVMLALRDPADLADPIGPAWLEHAARDLTSLGSITVLALVLLAAIGFLCMVRKRAAALLVLASVGGGMLLSTLLKHVFERARPDLVPHGVEVHTASFPSGHAMLSAATYLTLGALLARVQPHPRVKAYLLTVAVVLAVLIGVSRGCLGAAVLDGRVVAPAPGAGRAGCRRGRSRRARWMDVTCATRRWARRPGTIGDTGYLAAPSTCPAGPSCPSSSTPRADTASRGRRIGFRTGGSTTSGFAGGAIWRFGWTRQRSPDGRHRGGPRPAVRPATPTSRSSSC